MPVILLERRSFLDCTALIHIKFSWKKLEDGKGIGGRGRLTAVHIDAMQNFYGKAIRDNKGNAAAMSKATHAILKHYSSTPENPRHADCPIGNESWYSYNRDLATGHTKHCPIQDLLPRTVVNVIQPTFDRLGDKHFLVVRNAWIRITMKVFIMSSGACHQRNSLLLSQKQA